MIKTQAWPSNDISGTNILLSYLYIQLVGHNNSGYLFKDVQAGWLFLQLYYKRWFLFKCAREIFRIIQELKINREFQLLFIFFLTTELCDLGVRLIEHFFWLCSRKHSIRKKSISMKKRCIQIASLVTNEREN